MITETSADILKRFLNFSISDSSEVFAAFSALPGAITAVGRNPLERYVYIPGTKEKTIVLVAHTDTVWDSFYGNAQQTTAVYSDGVFHSTNPQCGIGADDRAGCAMLWALRHSGHSLLLLDGEEKGKIGANYLRTKHHKLFRKLNKHQFMIELDWCGTGGCLYNQVENTQAFKDYISTVLGFQDSKQKGGCDLQILCQRICGVNLGVGYHNNHRPGETLDITQWDNTYAQLSAFLELEHPKFSIPCGKQCLTFLKRCKHRIGLLLRKLKLIK